MRGATVLGEHSCAMQHFADVATVLMQLSRQLAVKLQIKSGSFAVIVAQPSGNQPHNLSKYREHNVTTGIAYTTFRVPGLDYQTQICISGGILYYRTWVVASTSRSVTFQTNTMVRMF